MVTQNDVLEPPALTAMERIREDWDNLFPGRFTVEIHKLPYPNPEQWLKKPPMRASTLFDLQRRAKRYGYFENTKGTLSTSYFLFTPKRVATITLIVVAEDGDYGVRFTPLAKY